MNDNLKLLYVTWLTILLVIWSFKVLRKHDQIEEIISQNDQSEDFTQLSQSEFRETENDPQIVNSVRSQEIISLSEMISNYDYSKYLDLYQEPKFKAELDKLKKTDKDQYDKIMIKMFHFDWNIPQHLSRGQGWLSVCR